MRLIRIVAGIVYIKLMLYTAIYAIASEIPARRWYVATMSDIAKIFNIDLKNAPLKRRYGLNTLAHYCAVATADMSTPIELSARIIAATVGLKWAVS